jgi:hypothetical protein
VKRELTPFGLLCRFFFCERFIVTVDRLRNGSTLVLAPNRLQNVFKNRRGRFRIAFGSHHLKKSNSLRRESGPIHCLTVYGMLEATASLGR